MTQEAKLVSFLLIFSVIGAAFIWSSSIGIGEQKFQDPAYFIKRQIVLLAVAWAVYGALRFIEPSLFFRAAPFVLLTTGALSAAALFQGEAIKRWLSIGPVMFQPGEILKLAALLYLSRLFANRVRDNEIRKALLVGAGSAALLLPQPALSNFVIVCVIGFSAAILGGISWRKVFLAGGVAAAAIMFLMTSAEYRANRIEAFLNPEESYHLTQAKLAIGSGGLFGKGIGQGQGKLQYLPEAANDSIFAVIAEEVGFAGTSVVLTAYFAFGLFLLSVARKRRGEERLFVGAAAVWVIAQTLIHVGSNLGMMPPTGVTLPMVSYGGTSLVVFFSAFGIIGSILSHKNRRSA